MQLSTVFFDLGGTLFDYRHRERIGVPALDALRRVGLDPDDPAVRDARRRAGEEIERAYATRTAFLHRDLFRDRVARTAELMAVTAPPEVLDRFDAEHLQALLDHLIPRPDARVALEALRERGIGAAVVSNADDDYLGALIERHDLAGLLDWWCSSEEAGCCKPHPAIFEYALAKAGGPPAAQVLFVGDSLQHDIAGAQAMGMRTVLIGEPGTVAPLSAGLDASVGADFAVRTLVEVVEIVDRLNAVTPEP
jgi:HAD superfamily hydrolase (TIGR01509 family)